jgi:hypothetical protein
MATIISQAATAGAADRAKIECEAAPVPDGYQTAMLCFLDELPGIAVGIVTLTYLVTSVCALMW